MVSVEEFVISSANNVPGYKILETKGFSYGLIVRSRGLGGQIRGELRSILSGEIKEYQQMMEESIDKALQKLIDHAKSMGANGLVAIRYDSDAVATNMQEILAYGTAVVVEKE
ncbi:hypothetical protein ALNOE001_03510 [Candidatus Methanobinarius endosymbioticus]|uniref:UPF0145 protein ALNOE001_03510 n=1 Tax=Candidatus Methanobinarius endosymbioticus TaxID=2006182 RepID=A0A366MF66_9EURY|nr:hypothetical protein ALNOE001_03510 [Candidatus Methanobinarius endosymbioticus]